jgi:hypothetical protein
VSIQLKFDVVVNVTLNGFTDVYDFEGLKLVLVVPSPKSQEWVIVPEEIVDPLLNVKLLFLKHAFVVVREKLGFGLG